MDEKRVGDSDYRLAHELAHELERWELNADMFKQCCKRRGKRWQRCGVCLHFLHIASQELKIQISKCMVYTEVDMLLPVKDLCA